MVEEDDSAQREEEERRRREQEEAEEQQRQEEQERREQEERRRREEAERRRKEEEEEERRRQEEQEEADRQARVAEEARKKKEEEEEAKKKKTAGKKKGLGGLSPEKKKMLKQLILQKAAEEMKAEQKRRAEAKENHLKKVVGPMPSLEGVDEAGLKAKINELYKRSVSLEEEKYDWELRIRRQDYEMNELTIKLNDIKGKFVKPVLKKVNKTESKLARFDKKGNSLASFRTQLKSTGQHKFALDEKEDGSKNPDWRDHLGKPKSEKDGDEELEEGGANGEASADIEVAE